MNFHPLLLFLLQGTLGEGRFCSLGFGLCSFFTTRGRAWIWGKCQENSSHPQGRAQSAAGTSRGGQRDLSSCCWIYSQREVTKGAPSSPGQGLEQPGVVGGVPGWDWMGFKVSSSPTHSMIPSVSAPGSSSEFPRNKSQDLHSTLGFTSSGSVLAWIRPPPVPGMQIQVNQRFLGFFFQPWELPLPVQFWGKELFPSRNFGAGVRRCPGASSWHPRLWNVLGLAWLGRTFPEGIPGDCSRPELWPGCPWAGEGFVRCVRAELSSSGLIPFSSLPAFAGSRSQPEPTPASVTGRGNSAFNHSQQTPGETQQKAAPV